MAGYNSGEEIMTTYVYKHYMKGDLFYIGKGGLDRAFTVSPRKRSDKWLDIFSDGVGFSCEIYKAFESDAAAIEYEDMLIKKLSPPANTYKLISEGDGKVKRRNLKQVKLTNEQSEWLSRKSKEALVSKTAIVRSLIDAEIKKDKKK